MGKPEKATASGANLKTAPCRFRIDDVPEGFEAGEITDQEKAAIMESFAAKRSDLIPYPTAYALMDALNTEMKSMGWEKDAVNVEPLTCTDPDKWKPLSRQALENVKNMSALDIPYFCEVFANCGFRCEGVTPDLYNAIGDRILLFTGNMKQWSYKHAEVAKILQGFDAQELVHGPLLLNFWETHVSQLGSSSLSAEDVRDVALIVEAFGSLLRSDNGGNLVSVMDQAAPLDAWVENLSKALIGTVEKAVASNEIQKALGNPAKASNSASFVT